MTTEFSLKPLFDPQYGIKRLKLLRTIAISSSKGMRTRLVHDETSGEYYALKIARKRDICDGHRIEQVRSSLFVISRLRCPFAQNFFSFFQDEVSLYYLYEFIPGGGTYFLLLIEIADSSELFSYLRIKSSLSSDTTKFFVLEISSALMSIQKYKIILRSLMPETICLTIEGHIRLCDFDFAKTLFDSPGRAYTICGSPEYVAPEVIKGLGSGPAVDWWALGVLLFEMLTGRTPFFAETPYRVYQNIEQGRVAFPKDMAKADAGLVGDLLNVSEASRPGAGGEESLRRHPYFRGVDWYTVGRELLEPGIKPFAVERGGRLISVTIPEVDIMMWYRCFKF